MIDKKQLTRKHNIVFLFSGQGSHYRGMGRQLFENNVTFSQSLEDSDDLIMQHIGVSLIDEIYNNKNKHFDNLLVTHPAILAIELAMLDVMNELDILPDYISGNSLGELAAAVAAGIWTKEEALKHAIEQAKHIVRNFDKGGMIAIINQSIDVVKELLVNNNVQIVSENLVNHCTVAGELNEINQFQKQLENSRIQFLRLPVSYPFHSTLLNDSAANFFNVSEQCLSYKGKFISGLYCKEMESLASNYFWDVISQPTNFIQFVEHVETLGPSIYIDLGPSGTNATFVKYNLPTASDSITYQIMTPFNRELNQLNALQLMFNSSK